MNTTMLRAKVQLERKVKVKWKRWRRTIYHLPLQPSVRANGQTRAARVRGEQGGLQGAFFRVAKSKFFEERPISEEYAATVSNFLPDCLPVWGRQTRISICARRGIGTVPGQSTRFLHVLRAGSMSKSGARPCWAELGLYPWIKRYRPNENKKWF